MRLQFHKYGFHFVFLTVRHQPGDRQTVRFFYEEVAVAEHDLFFGFIAEKAFEVAAQRSQNVNQSSDRRAGKVVFKL